LYLNECVRLAAPLILIGSYSFASKSFICLFYHLKKFSVPSDTIHVSSINRHFMPYAQNLIQSETSRNCIQDASCHKPVFRNSDIHTQF
jgi:hypothetical protein